MRALTEGELQATVSPRPRPCGVGEQMWELVESYIDALPPQEWQGHPPGELGVPKAYAMRGGRWVHVLVETVDRRVAMVLVLNLSDGEVHGHRMLDLRAG
ncbi:hypothetical protein [Aquipuribacter sp. MA13-6]|uniref:hypothetical protein n=1 Tax=unclassified Aquipuribacter TaxID=2635084 RepID=UPI003EEDF3EE